MTTELVPFTTTAPVPFKRRRHFGGTAFKLVVALLYLFLLAPLIVVVIISFSSNQYLSFPPRGFSLRWYEGLPQQTVFMTGLKVSLISASLVTVIVIAIGVPVALAIARHEFKGKDLIASLFLSPLIVPTIVLALGLLMMLGPLGWANTYQAIVIGHLSITLPYIIRTTLITLQTSDTSCEAAARILGADAWTTFRRITLPIIAPGIAAGAIMAFIVSFDEAVISLFVAQSGLRTLPVEILTYVENQADASVAALSGCLILFSIVIVVTVERLMGLRGALR
jgi:putative spermidine/putrescine transport system permease protein